MYATVETNKLFISVADFYSMEWYEKGLAGHREEKFRFAYGSLEIDIHKNGKKYLTGFVVDPRKFVVDYLKTRYGRKLPVPRRIASVSVESDEHHELFYVEFLKTGGFVADEIEKDLIFPLFCRRNGQLRVQGLEVLDILSVFRYLVKRFRYRGTTLVRRGDRVFNLATGRRWKIRRR